MRNQAPMVAVRVTRSRFLLVSLMLAWLLLSTLLTLMWSQGHIAQSTWVFAMAALLGLALSLCRCYQQFFVGGLAWTGLGWILRPAPSNRNNGEASLTPASTPIVLTCIWDGQTHLLLQADKNWIWLDATMCGSKQWLALRRALLRRKDV